MEPILLLEPPKQIEPYKSKFGRPTKYDPVTTMKTVEEYINSCVDEEYDYQTLRGEKSDGFQYRIKVKLPSVDGLALALFVSDETVVQWCEIYADFSAAVAHIKRLQKERLLNGGLSNSYNPLISKFLLSANHGMSENTRVENTVILPKPIMEIPNQDVSQNNGN